MSYLKKIADSALYLPMARVDDTQAVLVRNLLIATLNEVFRYEYRQAKWAQGRLISISSTGLNEGAREVGWMELGSVGMAEVVADNAGDIPTADLEGNYTLNKAHTVAISIAYSQQDVRAARYQGMFDMVAEKAAAAREAHDRKIDELIRLGDPTYGFQGITNAAGRWAVTATTGAWASTASPQQIDSDFQLAYDAIYNGTSGVEEPDTCVLPSTVWGRISSLQHSVADSSTSLDFLKKSHPGISLWEVDAGLNTAGTGGTAAMMLYNRQPTRVRALMPMNLKPLPAEQHGLQMKVIFESRYAGLAVPKPKSVAVLSGI